MSEFLWQARAALVVAKKNAMVYYLKPPVFTFGIIFPLFFYLAFAAGHAAPPETMAPGIVAMALFFTASAVGPLVTPWERQAKTYERLITSPASLIAILSGDVLAGTVFGAILALLPLTIATLATSASVVALPSIALGIVLGSLSFAALGVLLAAPATQGPSQVMMLSNLVRLPLIFVSGVFIPLSQMPAWGRWLAPFSPLSYCADLIRAGFGEKHYWSTATDALALCAFITCFMLLAARWHRRTRDRAI
ncbi:MAG: ABC transporter permease [Proteobacteria bacterium]|nr:ABC transporter permease [Pseudomonadota bacterium]